jgi:hypothetical protein
MRLEKKDICLAHGSEGWEVPEYGTIFWCRLHPNMARASRGESE